MFKNQILIIIFSLGLFGMLFAIILILTKPSVTLEEQTTNTTKTNQDERVVFPRNFLPRPTNSGGVRLCNPNYSGCLLDDIGNYSCEGSGGSGPNFTGKLQVLGSDVFFLDKDQNGWACDKGDF